MSSCVRLREINLKRVKRDQLRAHRRKDQWLPFGGPIAMDRTKRTEFASVEAAMLFHLTDRLSFSQSCPKASAALRKIALAATAAAALSLSACVTSQKPLLTNAKPTLGQRFDVHFYESFIDKKASDFHTSSYSWKDGRYVRASGLAQDVTSVVYQPLEGNDYLIQGSGEKQAVYYYWIARKLIDGVYLIFPLNETDSDAAIRDAVCTKGQPTGVCLIETYDQLAMLARATAAKPMRDPSLGVVVTK
jgi:hypothetical protein